MRHVAQVMDFNSTEDQPALKKRGRINIDNVSLVFGTGNQANIAVQETSLDIEPGEFVCILGPSGCGKSTLLNSVAGYVTPTTGEVRVDGDPVVEPGPDRGMVFQQYSLLPWKTTFDNIALGPSLCGDVAATRTAEHFLDMVGLTQYLNHYRGDISGGTQQPAAIARDLPTNHHAC